VGSECAFDTEEEKGNSDIFREYANIKFCAHLFFYSAV